MNDDDAERQHKTKTLLNYYLVEQFFPILSLIGHFDLV